ncbi:uncharacterized protein PHALS_11481 [Plasmopara halstedii]|uniref:Uncharacterized protein n=1 Tax=Plasmopara halstedii TaxID=4781 RepID=A0A0P1A510_PLAHL|nr:uncharacterized protein PHALS_11481 [Plasmopara halstedii]CEG35610.1 hypothetical protein PHALS_11481 [Plasmopara halstedii]|eukprot:XP_024571979.1 hypothetical protein PHALS_11481 [Plasmopara halstedii]
MEAKNLLNEFMLFKSKPNPTNEEKIEAQTVLQTLFTYMAESGVSDQAIVNFFDEDVGPQAVQAINEIANGYRKFSEQVCLHE